MTSGRREKGTKQKSTTFLNPINLSIAIALVECPRIWNSVCLIIVPKYLIVFNGKDSSKEQLIIRIKIGEIDGFRIQKEVRQKCIYSRVLVSIHGKSITRNVGLEEIIVRMQLVVKLLMI